ncbi:acyl-CoA-binding domain-containing protein 4 isoform X2 [Emydura macquarii macquarii]|uniref:acyl-CoA-binding domain-containing protein 4 isoform X2 n=1 Tax=Emydura macquarii macquarii TaxID=1129001 RepID=UPI00352B3C94
MARSRERLGMEPEEPDYQQQFQAAVSVIQGLPKNGSYHPSYEVMLRFYSHYKQATVGSCNIPRPGFWDPIGRYKWDAWNRLGKMSKEEAMAAYISEMKKIAQKVIDTMPLGETSEDMFGFFEPLYEVIHDMPRPPESFFKKKAGKQQRAGQAQGPAENCLGDPASGEQKQEGQMLGGGLGRADDTLESTQVTSDSESEVYSDTLEQIEQAGQRVAGPSLSPSSSRTASWDADVRREAPAPATSGEGALGEGGGLDGRSPRPLSTQREAIPLAPGGLCSHPAVPHCLAFRGPVAAAAFPTQEEVMVLCLNVQC